MGKNPPYILCVFCSIRHYPLQWVFLPLCASCLTKPTPSTHPRFYSHCANRTECRPFRKCTTSVHEKKNSQLHLHTRAWLVAVGMHVWKKTCQTRKRAIEIRTQSKFLDLLQSTSCSIWHNQNRVINFPATRTVSTRCVTC